MKRIWWVQKPKFQLLENDGHWNLFECVRPGIVLLKEEEGHVQINFEVGWKTDVTSSPRWARGFVGQLGPHSPASLLHDRLLEFDPKRQWSRYWLDVQLQELEKVGFWKRKVIILGVWVYDVIFHHASFRKES